MRRRVLFAALGAVAMALAAPAAASALRTVTLSPLPGTPDASPATQISILGVSPAQIRGVRLTGSISGLVRGAFHAYSGRRGASFVPRRPLTQGEHVHVRVLLDGRSAISWHFEVARLAPVPATLNLPIQQPAKLQHFVSRPDLTPPKITILKRGATGAAGDIFLTPLPSPTVHPESNNAITIRPVGPGGPMIIDRSGNVVWFDQLKPPVYAINFRPQAFGHRQVLTWWQGTVTVDAFGQGEGVIADPSYRTIRTVKAGNGYPTDLHEFTITPAGDALFTIYSPIRVHLPGTPAGALSPLLDAIVQEVDIRTGLVVWEWHSYGHIPLKESYASPRNSADYDAFHINSIEQVLGNRLLVSARDTSAIYLLDRATGKVEWTLGGKASSFKLGRGARFYFQHDARMIAPNQVSLFDDEAGPPLEAPSSRGLVLALDVRHRRATVVHEYHRPGNATSAKSEGSVQQLANHNTFVGFGSTQFFSEFSPGGKLVFDASLPVDDGSYRAVEFPWTGTPKTRPSAAAKRDPVSGVDVYASWNGASTVTRWQVLAGSSTGTLKPVQSAARSGFETRIHVARAAGRFAVRALGSGGAVLAQSPTVTPS